MEILKNPSELGNKLKGCVVESINHDTNDESIKIYFTNGLSLCIKGEHIYQLNLNSKLEVVVIPS